MPAPSCHAREVAMQAVHELSAEQFVAMGLGGSRFWKAHHQQARAEPHGSTGTGTACGGTPRAHSDYSPMIFLMYYLNDTAHENGCRPLLPGIHRGWHQLRGRDGTHQGQQPDGRRARPTLRGLPG